MWVLAIYSACCCLRLLQACTGVACVHMCAPHCRDVTVILGDTAAVCSSFQIPKSLSSRTVCTRLSSTSALRGSLANRQQRYSEQSRGRTQYNDAMKHEGDLRVVPGFHGDSTNRQCASVVVWGIYVENAGQPISWSVKTYHKCGRSYRPEEQPCSHTLNKRLLLHYSELQEEQRLLQARFQRAQC